MFYSRNIINKISYICEIVRNPNQLVVTRTCHMINLLTKDTYYSKSQKSISSWNRTLESPKLTISTNFNKDFFLQPHTFRIFLEIFLQEDTCFMINLQNSYVSFVTNMGSNQARRFCLTGVMTKFYSFIKVSLE